MSISSGAAGSGGAGAGGHSPSLSLASLQGMGPGSFGGAPPSPSSSLSAPAPPSSLRKTFAVSSLKSLNRRQNYVLVLEFERGTVSFHKVRRGKEVKRAFPFHACVKLERGGGGGSIAAGAGGSIGGASALKGSQSGPGAMGSGAGSGGGGAGGTQLTATFGHEPRYKKLLIFASTDERELFCNLVHAMIVSGPRAVTLFKSLQTQAAAAAAQAAAAQAASNGSGGAGAAEAKSQEAPAAIDDASAAQVQGLDFCEFLISFSSAQTQLSHSHALHSPAGAGSGAGGNAMLPFGARHAHAPSIGGGASHFDDLASSMGGRARANASDPQAAILAFLAANNNNGPDGGAGAINGLASANLVSLLHGRLLEGETPVNSSDITYRVECECGGMGHSVMFRRNASAGGSAGSGGGAGAASGQADSASSSAPSSSSSAPGSGNGGGGVSASSRGLFLLTNYRILYLNYAESTSYAATEAAHNFESYAPWAPRGDQALRPFAADGGEGDSDFGGSRSASLASTASGSVQGSSCTCDADIPLGSLLRVSRSPPRGSSDGCEISLKLKDGRTVQFGFDCTPKWVEGLVGNIARMAWPKDQSKLFAFSYAYRPPLPGPQAGLNPFSQPVLDGWDLYDALADYTRLTLATDPSYRIVTSNLDFSLCASYPRLLIEPQWLLDGELKSIAAYRSQARLPAVVWIHPVTRATLSRCAQPLVGLNRKRSELDEKLVSLLRTCNPSNASVIHIFDARPWKAAVGNTAMGKGFENIANYSGATLEFCSIDNIHAIRGSLEKLRELTQYTEGTPSAGASSYYASSASTSSGSGGGSNGNPAPSTFLSSASPAATASDESFLSKLEGSLWMHYVRLVLAAAQKIAIALSEEGASCITHCSDGWDRTSQLSALAQLMLDPFYRTLEGFAILVEKEWLSFGHRFAERHGHASPAWDDEQRAPIFLQFLDAVFQLLRQFPASFEFNDDFLIAIFDHVSSNRFGTFLYNSSSERERECLTTRTVSLWTFLLHQEVRAKFMNSSYIHPPHVARWDPRQVGQQKEHMADLVRTARKQAAQAAADASAAGGGGGAGSGSSGAGAAPGRASAAWPAAAPVSSGLPPIPPLTSSSPAAQHAAAVHSAFYCIPSVSARRLALWEKMHLRHDREFVRTRMQIQAQIAARVAQAAAARALQKDAAAAAAAAVPPLSPQSAAAAAGPSATPSPELDSAWAARYALLASKIQAAGLDLEQLESQGTLVKRGDKQSPVVVGIASSAAASSPGRAGAASSSVSPLNSPSGATASGSDSDATRLPLTSAAVAAAPGSKAAVQAQISASQLVMLKASIDGSALSRQRASLIRVQQGAATGSNNASAAGAPSRAASASSPTAGVAASAASAAGDEWSQPATRAYAPSLSNAPGRVAHLVYSGGFGAHGQTGGDAVSDHDSDEEDGLKRADDIPEEEDE